MSTELTWIIYGATGYTGRHIAALAASKGMRPVLAGRNGSVLADLASRLDLEWRAFNLDEPDCVAAGLSGHQLLLNCAGPFVNTYGPLIEACMAEGVHYLDITGEVPVCEALDRWDLQAKERDIVIMPAVGFDMVPGDCLGAMLQRGMPDATDLQVAYAFEGAITRGSVRTSILTFTPDVLVRRDGELIILPNPIHRSFDFGPQSSFRNVVCPAVTFGDISTTWRTTGIPNVTAFIHMSKQFLDLAQIAGEEDINRLPEGPDDAQLTTMKTYIVATVTNKAGDALAARLTTPQTYAITFPLAVECVRRVLEGRVAPGYRTPAASFGQDYIERFEGCLLEWDVTPTSRETDRQASF